MALLDELKKYFALKGETLTRSEIMQIVSSPIAIDIVDPKPANKGLYRPVRSGIYTNLGGLMIDLTEGLNEVIFDGQDFHKIVTPLNQNLKELHTQWANEWMAAGAGRNYVFSSNGFLESGEIRWADGAFGVIDNIQIEDRKYKKIRLNRPASENRYIEFEYEYESSGAIKRVITHSNGY